MVSSSARGIALVSGSGGTGRTTAALNLSYMLAGQGAKVLLADMCFGWGGLISFAADPPTFEILLDSDAEPERIVTHATGGFDLLTSIPPDFLEPSVDDYKKFTWLISRLCFNYDYIIYDTPASGHPLSLLAAGMSRKVLLFIRPDAISFATSYRLLKSLHAEGINERVSTVFTFVNSGGHAASLKTRFDLVTTKFLGLRLASSGFIGVSEALRGEEFVTVTLDSNSIKIIENFSLDECLLLQNETVHERHSRLHPGRSQ